MKPLSLLELLLVLSAFLIITDCHHTTEPPLLAAADTTSHNIFWEIDVLGDGSGSRLRDVAIVSDTLVYAVGEIYLRDSLGNWDGLPYTLARWNGQRWDLKRVTFPYRGNPITPPLYAILAFSPTDIWLSAGVPIHGDGESWTQYHLFDMGVLSQDDRMLTTIWGTAEVLYFGGVGGTLVRRTPSTWQRISTGTRMKIGDIYGTGDEGSGAAEILAVASDPYDSLARKILSISGTTVSFLPDLDIKEPLSTLWFVPGKQYYLAGSGIYQKNLLTDAKWRNGPLDIATCYIEGMTGTAFNDIFTVGDFGEILHWNGSTWHNYINQTRLSTGLLYRVAIKEDQIFAVGVNNQKAVVVRGRRIH